MADNWIYCTYCHFMLQYHFCWYQQKLKIRISSRNIKSCDRQILHTGSMRDPLYVKLKIFDYTCKTTSSPGRFLSKTKMCWRQHNMAAIMDFLCQLVNISTIYLSAKFGNWVTITPEISNYIFGHVTVSKRWRHRWTFWWWRFFFFIANQCQQKVSHTSGRKSHLRHFSRNSATSKCKCPWNAPGLLGLKIFYYTAITAAIMDFLILTCKYQYHLPICQVWWQLS